MITITLCSEDGRWLLLNPWKNSHLQSSLHQVMLNCKWLQPLLCYRHGCWARPFMHKQVQATACLPFCLNRQCSCAGPSIAYRPASIQQPYTAIRTFWCVHLPVQERPTLPCWQFCMRLGPTCAMASFRSRTSRWCMLHLWRLLLLKWLAPFQDAWDN